jgi:hypothetical protein
MSYTSSFIRERVFVLLVVFISVFSLFSLVSAQEEVPENEGISIINPQLTSFEDNTLGIQFSIKNHSLGSNIDVQYGVEMLTASTRGVGQGVHMFIDSEVISFAPGETKEFSMDYTIPPTPAGTYDFYVVVRNAEGGEMEKSLLTTQRLLDSQLSIEVQTKTCEYALDDQARISIKEPIVTETEGSVTIFCSVLNNTEEEQVLYQSAKVLRDATEEPETVVVGTRVVTLDPNSKTEVAFNIPTPEFTGDYQLILKLLNENTISNEVLVGNLTNENPITQTAPSGEKENTSLILPLLVTILALIVLIAIFIYKRKQTQPLSETLPPEEGTIN